MSNGIAAQTGPFMHALDAKATKTFEGGRTFTVLIAGAYNAGIIGSEHNGIAILDEDNRAIVLDQHLITSSGYNGPSQAQRAEFKRIMEMDWKAFAEFMRTNPRYRGSVPDVNNAKPDAPQQIESRVIFPASAKNPSNPYPMPLEDRKEIIAFLTNHAVHKVDGPYSDFALAWNVKVYGFDSSGKSEGYDPDPMFDEKWEAYIANPEVFFEEATDALRSYLEGEYTLWSGEDAKVEMCSTGRSGGWLILDKLDGRSLSWGDMNSLEEDLDSMSDAELVQLYVVVSQLDEDLKDPKTAMQHQYAFRRECMEDQWAAEMSPTAP